MFRNCISFNISCIDNFRVSIDQFVTNDIDAEVVHDVTTRLRDNVFIQRAVRNKRLDVPCKTFIILFVTAVCSIREECDDICGNAFRHRRARFAM